ncbi:hypothetical protein DHW03_15505 [Pedobacter yonginense]|uniref:Uncharacterized protein n=1 Tax=Pedobacter yonginense TaxID=651869 RepID=A0A317EJC3_9SPHI|nr:hypothetical protein [Pedobacter yonginense]PWS26199.1 hypothetical protein DHW03_15505 [Pedobacter yonginense]
MEQNANGYMMQTESGKMVVLDYVFGEGDIQSYQLIRFAAGEAWNVVFDGRLLALVRKDQNKWIKVIGETIDEAQIFDIGKFIDAQHFNLLPSKIKSHWQEYVAEVIIRTDSEYMIVTRPNISFERFQKMFCSFIEELVEDPWPIDFKVYNSEFTNEFHARVS